ncbi:MAG: FMN-binding protein [Firmicutes bacterium]|nr:FMN-binding protein [Bacillota bacterium]
MWKVLLAILGGFVVVMVGAGVFLMAGQSSIKSLQIRAVDFTRLRDGTYTGQFKGGRWSNTVRVTVSSGKVTDIDVLKEVRIPKTEVTEQVVRKIIETQSLDVDTVSGATINTKAYLKAVENALTAAEQ